MKSDFGCKYKVNKVRVAHSLLRTLEEHDDRVQSISALRVQLGISLKDAFDIYNWFTRPRILSNTNILDIEGEWSGMRYTMYTFTLVTLNE